MRCHALTICVVTIIVGCGGKDSTAPKPTGQLQLSVVGGSLQSDSIDALLAQPVKIQAVRVANGISTPAANQLVNFVVVEPGCGRAFAGSAMTDASGSALDRWELGESPGLCHMEIRAVDQMTAQPVVYGTATATIKPGAPVSMQMYDHWTVFLRSRNAIGQYVPHLLDRLGHETTAALSITAPAGWSTSGDTLIAPSTEHVDTVTVSAGKASARMQITAARDLRLSQWSASLACGPLYGRSNDAGTTIDSLTVPALTVDSVVYGLTYGDTTGMNVKGDSYFVWSGQGTFYLRGGGTEAHFFDRVHTTFHGQGVNSLLMVNFANNPNGGLTLVNTTPLTYSGNALAWCWQMGSGAGEQHTFTLTAH